MGGHLQQRASPVERKPRPVQGHGVSGHRPRGGHLRQQVTRGEGRLARREAARGLDTRGRYHMARHVQGRHRERPRVRPVHQVLHGHDAGLGAHVRGRRLSGGTGGEDDGGSEAGGRAREDSRRRG